MSSYTVLVALHERIDRGSVQVASVKHFSPAVHRRSSAFLRRAELNERVAVVLFPVFTL